MLLSSGIASSAASAPHAVVAMCTVTGGAAEASCGEACASPDADGSPRAAQTMESSPASVKRSLLALIPSLSPLPPGWNSYPAPHAPLLRGDAVVSRKIAEMSHLPPVLHLPVAKSSTIHSGGERRCFPTTSAHRRPRAPAFRSARTHHAPSNALTHAQQGERARASVVLLLLPCPPRALTASRTSTGPPSSPPSGSC